MEREKVTGKTILPIMPQNVPGEQGAWEETKAKTLLYAKCLKLLF